MAEFAFDLVLAQPEGELNALALSDAVFGASHFAGIAEECVPEGSTAGRGAQRLNALIMLGALYPWTLLEKPT